MTLQNEHSIMRRKSIAQMDDEAEKSGLFKSLGLWQLTAIGVGGIIGIGIFTLAGLVASGQEGGEGAGPAVLISFLIAGLASAAAALSYAEFAGMIPRAGSAYTYGYVALGEIIGWFIGWDLLLEYIAIVAVVAIGISGYFTEFMAGIGIDFPVWMQGTADVVEGGVVNLPAIVVCLFITFILSRGTKTFGRFELVAVAIKILLILFIIGLGFFLRQRGQLLAVHAQRVWSGVHRCSRRVLRGVRLRRNEYRCGRSRGRQKAHAEGDPAFPGHRHDALRAGNAGTHRYAELGRS
jgi:APA family basic amino acid/polyamine antiporter